MGWITPITDRTQADADRLTELNCIGWHGMTEEERTEWVNSKGALNESDFNRVEHNLRYLSDMLQLDLTTYEDNIPYIIGMPYVTNLKANLNMLKSTYAKTTTPEVPDEPLKSLAWNDVEQIILDCYETFNKSRVYYQSIDELHAGELIGLVL